MDRALISRVFPPLPADGNFTDGVRSEDLFVPSVFEDHRMLVRVFEPQHNDEASLPVLVWVHGGGFVLGHPGNVGTIAIAKQFAREMNMLVISVDYRLAPEYKFPKGLEDVYSVMKWVEKRGVPEVDSGCLTCDAFKKADWTRLAVGGDSAGGNLAATVALMRRDRNDPDIIKHLSLVYPCV